MLGRHSIFPSILNIGTRLRWAITLPSRSHYTKKSSQYPLDKRTGGSQSGFSWCRYSVGNRTPFVQPVLLTQLLAPKRKHYCLNNAKWSTFDEYNYETQSHHQRCAYQQLRTAHLATWNFSKVAAHVRLTSDAPSVSFNSTTSPLLPFTSLGTRFLVPPIAINQAKGTTFLSATFHTETEA